MTILVAHNHYRIRGGEDGVFEASLDEAAHDIDALDENAKAQHRPNLYSCLKALNACYVTLEMYNESKAIQQRIATIEAGQ